MTFPLRLVRVDDPIPALELQRADGTDGWFVAPLPRRARWRFRYRDWPVPHLRLEDTPRPRCASCEGDGGHTEPYGHPETGEYDGERYIACGCWDPWREPALTVRVPRWAARRWFGFWPPTTGDDIPF